MTLSGRCNIADMTDSTRMTLIWKALRAREYSFGPISGFVAGAALLGEDGMIYRGCNTECTGLAPSSYTERMAFLKAVSEGCSKFRVTAIVGGPEGKPLADYYPPCGVYRQLMAQLCSLDTFKVTMTVDETDWKEYALGELFPMVFQRFNPNVWHQPDKAVPGKRK